MIDNTRNKLWKKSQVFRITKWVGAKEVNNLDGKKAYLAMVNAEDCIKDIITQCYLMQLQASIESKSAQRAKKVKPLLNKFTKKEIQAHEEITEKLREADIEEWSTDSEASKQKDRDDKDLVSVPSHYKKYNVEERKIKIQLPDMQNKINKSYDGPEDAKKIDIAKPGEECILQQT